MSYNKKFKPGDMPQEVDEEFKGENYELGLDNIFNIDYKKDAKIRWERDCKDLEELSKKYKTDLEKGINSKDSEEMNWRLAHWGNNIKEEIFLKSYSSFLFDELYSEIDPSTALIFICAILNIIVGCLKFGLKTGWMEGFALLIIVFIQLLVDAYLSYIQYKKGTDREIKQTIRKFKVIRNGKEEEVDNYNLYAGDIVFLKKDEKACFDGVVLSGNGTMYEFPITEDFIESKKVPLTEMNLFTNWEEKSSLIFSGTYCLEGEMKILILKVGLSTFEARKRLLEFDVEEALRKSFLEEALMRTANVVGDLAVFSGLLIGVAMIIKGLYLLFKEGNSFFSIDCLDIFANAFSVLFSLTFFGSPTGLLFSNNISNLSMCYKMMTKNILVNNINKAQHLSEVNNLIIDMDKYLLTKENKVQEGIKKEIKEFEKAGIFLRALSPNNLEDSVKIASETGLITKEEAEKAKQINDEIKSKCQGDLNLLLDRSFPEEVTVLEGEVFRVISKAIINKKHSEEPFDNFIRKLKLIFNATSEDKYLLTTCLKKFKKKVAITAKEIKDLAAMDNSHISFLSGLSAPKTFGEKVDIFLLNKESLNTLKYAFFYGRGVVEPIKKFAIFNFIFTFTVINISFVGIVFLRNAPFNPFKIILLNLILGYLPAIAFSADNPSKNQMELKPNTVDTPLINNFWKKGIVASVLLQGLILSLVIFSGDIIFGVESDSYLKHFMWDDKNGYHLTILYEVLISMTAYNMLNIRRLKKAEKNPLGGIFKNITMMLIILLIVIILFILGLFEGWPTRLRRLSFIQHMKAIGLGKTVLIIGILIKLLPFEEGNEELNKEVLNKEELMKDDLKDLKELRKRKIE